MSGRIIPQVLRLGPDNRVDGCLSFPASGGEHIRDDGDARWRLTTACAVVSDRPGAREFEFTWMLETGSATRCAVAVAFEFDDWATDNFVFAPSAVYNGNRFAFKNIPWPTYLLYCDPSEQRLDAPTTVNDCPRLKPDGAARIDLTTGSVATPLLGFYSPAKKRGWLVLTTQGNRLGNHGLSVEENADHSAATFMISSPAVRLTRADGSHLAAPSGDAPADWQAGDSASIRCRIHTFDAPAIPDFLRYFCAIRKELNPSRRLETLPYSAARQQLEALYHAHRWDEDAQLFRLNDPHQERMVQIWQLGWVGGGQVTLPLLQSADAESRDRALRNIETIFNRSQAASGFFYSTGDTQRFVSDKFRPQFPDGLILLRKNADWLYMAQRQFKVIESTGGTVPAAWKVSLRRQADAFAQIWQKNNQFGQWADVETGELKVGGSTSCAIVCGALALASQTYAEPRYLEIATEAARNYHRDFVLKGYTGGGPAEALSAPDSESAFALLESYMALYETTGGNEWLQFAADLLPLCASWAVSYDFKFPADSALGRVDARSCGTVWASVQNKHSAPGICTWSGDSLLKYYRATGDRAALELLADIAHGITQYISRANRPVGTMKPGGICERVNLSDWEGAEHVGGHIFDSCSWCETAALLTVTQIPGLYVRPDLGEWTVFDHVTVEKLPSAAGTLKLNITNPTKLPAEIRALVETAEERKMPMPLLNDQKIKILRLEPGASTEIVF